MNILSLFSHAHAQTASPLATPGAQAQTKSSPVTANAASDPTGGSSGSGSGGSSSATITANDFLTLLVTEIQNQDPTSQTDPMTYITQLVGVNSLQQLMQINQTLTTDAGTPASTPAAASSSPAAASAAAKTAIQAAQMTTGAAASNSQLLPLGVSGQATTASTNAVAQAFTHPTVMPQQVAPPTQVPLNPEVLRALEHSIPGAKLTAPVLGAQ